MTRRDTIMVAVLVNAGLLVILFASALKSDGDVKEVAVAAVQEASAFPVKKEGSPVVGDEVDQVLSQYAQVSSPSPVVPEVPPAQVFAEDLKMAPAPSPMVALAPEVAQSASSTECIEHKVKKGDVLEKLARYYHCKVDEIMQLNHLTSTNLHIGQVLKIAKTSAIQEPRVGDEPKYYVVKNGDNPWTIAVKNHIKVEELLQLNGLDENKARKLKPGDRIRIR